LAETSINYLFSNSSLNQLSEGYLFTMCPPLRSKEEMELLQKKFQQGAISVLSTDHCAFYKRQKEVGKEDFTRLPFGLGTVEISYRYLLSQVLQNNFISLSDFVKVTSSNPAKILGIYPLYGDILPDSWANLTIVDPNKVSYVNPSEFLMGTDYSQFSGDKLQGEIAYLFSRGEILVYEGKLVSEISPGRGKFLPL
jgi:dihydropyrimidinase